MSLLFAMWAVHTGPTVSYIVIRLYATAIVLGIALWALPAVRVPGRPAAVAAVVVLIGAAIFLASPASDFVTGTMIPVDGGYSILA